MHIRRQEGQGLAEYALILALIAVLVVGVLMFLGTNIQTILSKIAAAL
jgi:pilus assembly protein Flp/PilA